MPSAVSVPSRPTDPLRPMPSASSKSAMPGCSIESELVIAAMKRTRKNIAPNRLPAGMALKTMGSTLKPSPKVPCPATPATPRNATAAGSVIRPPSATSQNSFVALAVSPLSTMSSRGPT